RTGRVIAALVALEALGARVETAALDVARAAPLATVLAARRARGEPPVRGVVHAAGALAFHALGEHDEARPLAAFDGKALGAWNLHQLLAAEPLDCFVLCSSSSTLLGSPLLGGYAGANAFLDGLAHFRRARGLPALSVNWGTWGEVGMAVSAGRSMS